MGWFGQLGSTVKKSLGTIMSNFWGLIFLCSHGQKMNLIFFWKYCNACNKKLNRINVKNILVSNFYGGKTSTVLLLQLPKYFERQDFEFGADIIWILYFKKINKESRYLTTQCVEVDLNKKSCSGPKTTTAWMVILYRFKITIQIKILENRIWTLNFQKKFL